MRTEFASSLAGRNEAGFTLAEIVMASGLFVLLTSVIVGTYLFGLQLHESTQAKLGSNDDARKAVMAIEDEIRSATRIAVGKGGQSNFTEIITNTLIGPAIQIYPTSDTNTWVRYYGENDPGSTNYGRLCCLVSTNGTNYTVVVPHNVLNPQTLFTSEDGYGNVLTNNQNNRIIGLNLQFYAVVNTLAQNSRGRATISTNCARASRGAVFDHSMKTRNFKFRPPRRWPCPDHHHDFCRRGHPHAGRGDGLDDANLPADRPEQRV